MGGNAFGTLFKVTTFGESHGPGIGAVIDGCPSRIALVAEDFVPAMTRRRPGRTALDTPRREEDRVEILSGVFEGRTTGAPIALFIHNRDADSRPYEILRTAFRPGHADYSFFRKYGHFDFRGGGRSSARETAARVAAGVVAQKILEPVGIQVTAQTLEMGGIQARKNIPGAAENNPFFCPDPEAAAEMEGALKKAREEHDSLGGIVEVRVAGCPAGLGEPVFDKLDADLARAVMSVGAVKGVEIGAGFAAARLSGSENNDPLTPQGFRTNRAGGILGGISNGDEIVLRAAVKPIPSIKREQETITREGQPCKINLEGRYDISAVPRVVPVLEAMVRLVLADHLLRFRAIGNEKLFSTAD
ncbi:MAG: chorismate synthase [Deltaproteobacteria bacterium]|nr:chorismate synthase [Deltaproteobacteria bacterium]